MEDLGAAEDADNPATTSALQELVACARRHHPFSHRLVFLIYFWNFFVWRQTRGSRRIPLPLWAITFVSFTIPIITGLCRFDMLGLTNPNSLMRCCTAI